VNKLVASGIIGWPRLIELLSAAPARILNVPGGTLVEGGPADLTIIAPDAPVTIRAAELVSKSKNTPFDGWTLTGAAAATIVGGRTVFVNRGVTGAEVFEERA
jgi:dihydroorotase